MGIGIKSLFEENRFKPGDIIYMQVDTSHYVMEIIANSGGNFGYDVQFLADTGTSDTWIGPMTLHAFNARKIA